MIEQEIERLSARDAGIHLDHLEQDIWHKEQMVQGAAAASRRLASCQALVLSLSVVSAGILGAVTAAHAVPPPSAGWFGASAQLAPANLLLGTKP
jgi:hypothetical protein